MLFYETMHKEKHNKRIFVHKTPDCKNKKKPHKVQIIEKKRTFYNKKVVFSQKVFFQDNILPSLSMNRNSSTTKIRIKDIAEKAGTSIGSVDRVLHGRPNVSDEVRKRVEQAIKELEYEPNRYASALATNKSYRFIAFFPSPDVDLYWGEAAQGIRDAIQYYRDFNLSLEELYYDMHVPESYPKGLDEILQNKPDGVIIVPQLSEVTYKFCQELEKEKIPYTFLDSNICDLNALTYYGQDSIMSGRFAARMSVLEAAPEQQFLIIHFDIPSLQQYNREVGFKEFIQRKYPDCIIHELALQPKDPDLIRKLNTFRAEHPEVHFICTFCSYTHLIAEALVKEQITDCHVMGYDMLDSNIAFLKEGTIRFLIAQHPWQQGYGCVDALFQHIVLKKEIKRDNFMPIELLTAENCDFYLRNAQTTY